MTCEFLTTAELAERLKISPHTVRRWSRAGKIPTVWLSRTVRRFDLAAVCTALNWSAIDAGRQNGGGR
ncbi:MAG: helix-turn-helix domain-containing protein [Planctomycetaceae bacterium]